MIISINKAILHILDANSGVTVFSDKELDLTDDTINAFITKHIEKTYEDPGLRKGEFNPNSGFKYQLNEYRSQNTSFEEFSLFAAHKMYDALSASEKTESCDLLVCDCVITERPVIAVLKCDNKIGFTHRVTKEDGNVQNELINHYAILPSPTQKISECAYVDTDDYSIKFSSKKRNIDGESADLMPDILLECIYDISSKESINAVDKIAKNVAEDNGGDCFETMAKMKKYIVDLTENTEEDSDVIDTENIAEAVFDSSPVMREEFKEKLKEANVPDRFESNSYITKKFNSNVKLVTDTGIEIRFPAEYYRDSDYMDIITNDDGTISIELKNIGEILSK